MKCNSWNVKHWRLINRRKSGVRLEYTERDSDEFSNNRMFGRKERREQSWTALSVLRSRTSFKTRSRVNIYDKPVFLGCWREESPSQRLVWMLSHSVIQSLVNREVGLFVTAAVFYSDYFCLNFSVLVLKVMSLIIAINWYVFVFERKWFASGESFLFYRGRYIFKMSVI